MCPGCYKTYQGGYCPSCRKKLFDGTNVSIYLPFETPKDQNLREFHEKTKRLSISGVQLKYSLKLDGKKLLLTERDGEYILKPIPPTIEIEKNDQAPENEHLTMQIAAQIFDIRTAANALIYFQDGTPAYLTRRFDVKSDGSKYQQEDMAQISGRTKQSHGDNFKYDGTYEEIGELIGKYAAAAIPSKENFFKLLVFNYLFSNGDAHLKNFSLIRTDMGDYSLSNAYDLMSTVLHTPGEPQTALDLYKGYTETEFYAIYGAYGQVSFRELAKRMGIQEKRSVRIITQMLSSRDQVKHMIDHSLLSEEAKQIYHKNYLNRLKLMGLTPNLIIEAVSGQLQHQEVKLVLPRARTAQGKIIELLPDNKYLFQYSENSAREILDADQLYQVMPI